MQLLSEARMEPFLKTISDIIPDEKIDQELQFPKPCRGPRSRLKPSQLYRIHLLLCLKRLISFRQLRSDLIHHRDWRMFSKLKNKSQVPTLRALSEFRQNASELLRQINQFYLRMIFSIVEIPVVIVTVPDSTDIRAATKGFAKKTAVASKAAIIPGFILPKMLLKDIAQKNLASLNGLLVTKNTRCVFCF
jgi:hypothetical protein